MGRASWRRRAGRSWRARGARRRHTRLPGGWSSDVCSSDLEVAGQNALRRGIRNFETRVADVSELPFEDETFDVVSCRFGFMFFPDMQQAANEMTRGLNPGGDGKGVVEATSGSVMAGEGGEEAAYEITRWLEFRRVLFRSGSSRSECPPPGNPELRNTGGRCFGITF